MFQETNVMYSCCLFPPPDPQDASPATSPHGKLKLLDPSKRTSRMKETSTHLAKPTEAVPISKMMSRQFKKSLGIAYVLYGLPHEYIYLNAHVRYGYAPMIVYRPVCDHIDP